MKKQLPAFLLGMLAATLVAGLTVTALAASGQMTITVDPINIQVNGETFQPKDANGNDVAVFAYNGTTYAPLRALAEAYGLEVGYDPETNMATVKEPEGGEENPGEAEPNVPVYNWSEEEEAAYQEFKGMWNEERISEDRVNLTMDYQSLTEYANRTPRDLAYAYIKRLSEEYFYSCKNFSDEENPTFYLYFFATGNTETNEDERVIAVWHKIDDIVLRRDLIWNDIGRGIVANDAISL